MYSFNDKINFIRQKNLKRPTPGHHHFFWHKKIPGGHPDEKQSWLIYLNHPHEEICLSNVIKAMSCKNYAIRNLPSHSIGSFSKNFNRFLLGISWPL